MQQFDFEKIVLGQFVFDNSLWALGYSQQPNSLWLSLLLKAIDAIGKPILPVSFWNKIGENILRRIHQQLTEILKIYPVQNPHITTERRGSLGICGILPKVTVKQWQKWKWRLDLLPPTVLNTERKLLCSIMDTHFDLNLKI